MFKHLLIATDGSPLSARGVKAGVRLARAARAKVTGLHVALAYLPRECLPPASRRKVKDIVDAQAEAALAPLRAEARKAGVACKTRTVVAGEPWAAILRTARSQGCDAIVMASHGRGGVRSLLLGSETTRVIAGARVPVLVVR